VRARTEQAAAWKEERERIRAGVGEPYASEWAQVRALEEKRKTAADKKAIQRQLDSLRNRQLGPKWKKAAEDLERVEALDRAIRQIEAEAEQARDAPWEEIQYTLDGLERMGFLADGALTPKGVMATEINEGHPVALVEYFLTGHWESLSDVDSMMVLAAFLGEGRDEGLPLPPFPQLEPVEHVIKRVNETMGLDPPYRASRAWVEPMRMWWEGQSAAEIAEWAGVFEGNVYRSLGKLINLVNEVMTLATFAERVGEVDKWVRVSERLRRSAWTGESLYLRL
jgi:superfamily II RNA helicase